MNGPVADPPVGGTIDRILSLLPSLNPSAQRVAELCATRPHDVIDMSGADLAQAAGTSAASVTRTSQALGFHGFQHLRMLLVRDLGAAAQADTASGEGTAGWLRSLAEGAAGLLQTALASVDADEFDAAADAIAQAPRVLVVGSGASHAAAESVAVSFVMNGRSCEAPTDSVVQQLTASVLTPRDVCLVVSASGANAVTIAAAKAARAAGATVIGVTGFARAPLSQHCTIQLIAGARFQSWDHGALGNGLVQVLLLTALQVAVSERMAETAERARAAILKELGDFAARDDTVAGSTLTASSVPGESAEH